MSAAILFRYHRAFDVCVQTLRQLRRLNPGVAIHGLYGGGMDVPVPRDLISLLDSNWTVPIDDPFYKWKNGDLCARMWFQQQGRRFDFDHLYFLEWDMLFTRPLHKVYGRLDDNANYATMFADYAKAQADDWWWITGQYGMETSWLLEALANAGTPVDLTTLEFGNMGAAVFCRAFLEKLAAQAVPSYSNDELRLSVYSRLFGMKLLDNGIKTGDGNIFHAEEAVLTREDFDRFMAQNGQVIHPLRFVIDGLDELIA